MAAQQNTRVCTCCKRRKPTTGFYRRGDDPNRFRSHCKACIERRTDKAARVLRARTWRKANPSAARVASRAWRKAHPGYDAIRWARNIEAEKLRNRSSYKRNRSKRLAYQQRFNLAHAAEISRYRSAWWKRNAASAAEYRNRRRAAKRRAGGTHTAADIKALFEKQRGICHYCPTRLVKYHVEHKTPLSRGGSNGSRNLALACAKCNLRKRTRTEREFRALLAA